MARPTDRNVTIPGDVHRELMVVSAVLNRDMRVLLADAWAAYKELHVKPDTKVARVLAELANGESN
jgi:hypothetical protein